MWFIGIEVEQETSASPPKKNPGSAPGVKCSAKCSAIFVFTTKTTQLRPQVFSVAVPY